MDDLCANEETGTIINNPDFCASYFYCQNDVALDRECPQGFYFEGGSVSCRRQRPDDIKCGLCSNSDDGDLVKVRGNCSTYGVCKNKLVAEERLCEPGEAFDMNDNVCMAKESAKCDERCDRDDGEFFHDKEDCRNYLHCDNGQVRTSKCPENLYFNEEKQFCSYKVGEDCIKK